MIKFKALTIKNFMSVGNISQGVNLENNNLILVLGENLDLGGNDNRNGVGKTALVNALSYALFGNALTNIRKDNLINKTNMKNMIVTLTFEVDGREYKIERGRKPNVFRFIKDGVEDEEAEDESQGEGRNTQIEIEHLIGFSHDMFKHIIALNTYVEPFLSLKTGDQRLIIEQLLGITKLSEKAEILKEDIKITKDKIKEEEFRISATIESNRRIEENIVLLESKSRKWNTDHQSKVADLKSGIHDLSNIDIDAEIANHKALQEIAELKNECKSLTKEKSSIDREVITLQKSYSRVEKSLKTAKHVSVCPMCNQEVDKETHERIYNDLVKEYTEISSSLAEKTTKLSEVSLLIDSVKGIIPPEPTVIYATIDEAYSHKNIISSLESDLRRELEFQNPYIDQINSLRETSIQEVNYDVLNVLVSHRDHQEFLLKLLTSKDSFIRKTIIDQNLTLLNHRLSQYIHDIGLPHEVKFKSDLDVEITLYGKEFDFDNLSRGERTRLILSLSWAFRDVFESMNDKINLLFIDELIDSGLDANGVEASMAILKKMSRENKKTVFLISHRDELVGRVSEILKVVKEGGFSTFEHND